MKTALAILLLAVSAAAQQIQLQPIATGLNTPLGLVSAGDSRLFIVERSGRILIFDGTRVLPTPFLDVSPLISCCDERGLLGLVFSPQYASNGFFFIDFTDGSGNINIARYKVSSTDPDRADTTGEIVLRIDHMQQPNHNGGQLQFGPDGYLYIGVGDGGGAGDPFRNGQNKNALLAKILRIDVSTLPYKIPPTNPFPNSEVWAYGLRNPWRFSFDRLSGDLIIADVGQDNWEEVDFQPAGSAGGQNYGWNLMEGTHCFLVNPCQDPTLTLPILEYSHAGGACSITGGYRYHGAKFPRMHDIYFYGDFCTGAIFGATQHSDGTWTSRQLASMPDKNSLSSFGEDANGELYAVDLNGAVYRIVDTSGATPRKRTVKH